jgi:hypothetical protein
MTFRPQPAQLGEPQDSLFLAPTGGGKTMLGLIALVLMVLWLLGFLAFHVSTGLIRILLVIGLIMLVFHFLRGSARTA